jgi:hypothetical protein
MFLHAAPDVFMPIAGGWGRLGITSVVLERATESIVAEALTTAWRNIAPKNLLKRVEQPPEP